MDGIAKQIPERKVYWHQRKGCKYYRARIITESEFEELTGKRKEKSFGVYGIYEDNELVYIGSTYRDFNIRFKEHRERYRYVFI